MIQICRPPAWATTNLQEAGLGRVRPCENRGLCERIDEPSGGSMTKRFWGCALMTFLSAAVSAGFSLAGLLGSGNGDSFARYATSRSVALLLTVLIAIGVRSPMAIAFLGIAMTSVQAFDGVIGAFAHDRSKTYGPFAFAVLNALAAVGLAANSSGG